MNPIVINVGDNGAGATAVASWLAVSFLGAKLVQKGLLTTDELLDVYDQAVHAAQQLEDSKASKATKQLAENAGDLLGQYVDALRASLEQ